MTNAPMDYFGKRHVSAMMNHVKFSDEWDLAALEPSITSWLGQHPSILLKHLKISPLKYL